MVIELVNASLNIAVPDFDGHVIARTGQDVGVVGGELDFPDGELVPGQDQQGLGRGASQVLQNEADKVKKRRSAVLTKILIWLSVPEDAMKFSYLLKSMLSTSLWCAWICLTALPLRRSQMLTIWSAEHEPKMLSWVGCQIPWFTTP